GWGARGVPRALRGRDRRVLRLPPLGQGAGAARARGRGRGLPPPRARPYGRGARRIQPVSLTATSRRHPPHPRYALGGRSVLESAPALRHRRRGRYRCAARVRIARACSNGRTSLRRAVVCRQLLALRSLGLLLALPLVLPLALVPLGDTALHDVRGRRGCARVRIAAPRPQVHTVLGGTLGRARLVTLGFLGRARLVTLGFLTIGHAAHDVFLRRRRRTRVREARTGAHVRPVLGRALVRRGLLALGPVVVR